MAVLTASSDSERSEPSKPTLTCDGQPVDITDYLGSGMSSRVWLGHIRPSSGATASEPSAAVEPDHWSHQPVVCKTFENRHMFKAELATWHGIKQRLAHTIAAATASAPTRLTLRAVSEDDRQPGSAHGALHTLFLSPVGKCEHDTPLTLATVRDMFTCLRDMRQLNVVHRDLTPRHFLRCCADNDSASHGLFVIGFGCAVLLPADGQSRLCGSLHFAPTSVLAQLANKVPWTYQPQLCHDLESMVEVCYALRCENDLSGLWGLGEDVCRIYDYWLTLDVVSACVLVSVIETITRTLDGCLTFSTSLARRLTARQRG